VNAKFTPAQPGTLVLTATIANGVAEGTNYTKDFTITVDAIQLPSRVSNVSLVEGNLMLGVAWDAATGATGYEVYCSTGTTPPAAATKTVTETFADITGLANGTTYYVWVKAKNNLGVSDFSTEISGTPAALTIPFTGYYKSTLTDGIEIKNGVFTYYDNADGDVGWAGTIVHRISLGADAGILIIQITEAGSWGKTPGAYYGIHYSSLNAGTMVDQSSATSADWTAPINHGVSTLAEAVFEYTIENQYYVNSGTYLFEEGSPVVNIVAPLAGTWVNDEMVADYGYFWTITMQGNTYIDEVDDNTGTIYTQIKGKILEITDPSQASGIIYLKLISGTGTGSEGEYHAVAWSNKSGDTIRFVDASNGPYGLATLEAAKSYLTFPSATDSEDFTKSPAVDTGTLTGIYDDDDDGIWTINNGTLSYSLDVGFSTILLQLGGVIVETTDTTQESGYIYIKITNVDFGDYSDLTPGNYVAVHWKNKNDGFSTVDLCIAYTSSPSDYSQPTLAGAKTTFIAPGSYFNTIYYLTATKRP
jgi:hypothetical protein